jgi:hypothetical protein
MNNDFMSDRDLDRELNSPEQTRMAEIVKALPEETLSMSWRSDLNARLRSEAARRKKLNLFGWIWKPTVGVALAGALAVAFMVRPEPAGTPVGSGTVEKALISSYVDNTAAWEVAGDNVGVNTVNEAKDSGAWHPGTTDWDQEDVGATL